MHKSYVTVPPACLEVKRQAVNRKMHNSVSSHTFLYPRDTATPSSATIGILLARPNFTITSRRNSHTGPPPRRLQRQPPPSLDRHTTHQVHSSTTLGHRRRCCTSECSPGQAAECLTDDTGSSLTGAAESCDDPWITLPACLAFATCPLLAPTAQFAQSNVEDLKASFPIENSTHATSQEIAGTDPPLRLASIDSIVRAYRDLA